MENCCRKTYFNMRNAITDQMAKVVTELKTEDGGQVSGGLVERMQRQLWDIMEDPEANIVAKSGKVKQLNTHIPQSVFPVSVISVTFVVTSTCCMCLGTIRALQVNQKLI